MTIWEPFHERERKKSLTLLTLLCYAFIEEPIITVSWASSSSFGWKLIQRPIAKHQVKLGESCGWVGDRIEWDWEITDTTRRPTLCTLVNGGSQRLTYQPHSMLRMILDPLHICSRSAAWSSCGYPHNRSRGCTRFCHLPVSPVPLTGLLRKVLVGEDVPSPADPWCTWVC